MMRILKMMRMMKNIIFMRQRVKKRVMQVSHQHLIAMKILIP